MKKLAKDSPAWLLMPGHRFLFGADPDLSKLPRVFSDSADNNMLWSTLGAAASTGTLAALITHWANRRAISKLEDKQRKLHAAKVDSLYPAAEADEATMPRAANSLGVEHTMPKAANSLGVEHTIIPVAAAIAAGMGAHALAGKSEEDRYAAELDDKIAKQKKKLQSLYDQLGKIYSTEDAQAIGKTASGQNWAGWLLTLASLGLLGSLAGGTAGGYYYTKKHSDEEAAKKVLEEDLLANNLTNIPDTVAMQLDPRRK